MRLVRIAFLVAAVAVVVAPGASAIDIDQDIQPPDGIVGQPYSFQLHGEEGCENSYHFKFDSGMLPPGLTVSDKGLLSGTPTHPGDYEFYIELTDDCGSVPSQGKFRLVIAPALVVVTSALKPVRVGVPYATTLEAVGSGTQTWSVSEGALPPGLTLSEKGSLSGTPTTAGSFTFTVKVKSPGPDRVATKQLTLVVAAPLAATAPAAKPAEVGVAFTTTPTATGGAAPFIWSVTRGSLPAGLSLDPATGTLSGTPSAAGSFAVTLAVADATGGSTTVDLTLTVAPRLTIATTTLPRASAGRAYRAKLTYRGGVGPVVWRFGGKAPRGLRIDGKTGSIVGVPRGVSKVRITVTATDALGVKATRTLVLVVRA